MDEGTNTIPRKSVADFVIEDLADENAMLRERNASLEDDNRILSDGWRVAIAALHDEKQESARLRQSNQRLSDEYRPRRAAA